MPLAGYTASLHSTNQVTVVTWGLRDDLPKNITPHGILASSCLTLLHQAEPPASGLFLGFSTLRWPCSSSLPGSLAMARHRVLTLRHTLLLIPTVSSCDLSAQWTQCVLGSISPLAFVISLLGFKLHRIKDSSAESLEELSAYHKTLSVYFTEERELPPVPAPALSTTEVSLPTSHSISKPRGLPGSGASPALWIRTT